jgi:FkbM family methyltransferase
VNIALDVGANTGQYGASLRKLGYRGRIESFEPGATAFAELSRQAESDPKWNVHRIALGDKDETRQLHIAGNSGASSSFLDMRAEHIAIAPDSAYVSAEDVAVRRLDDVAAGLLGPQDVVHLKMDVQGYEGVILDGAPDLLQRVATVEMEIAFIPLYDNQTHFLDAFRRMDEAGLGLVDLLPIYRLADHRIAWVDAVFARR